jgi:threonylcarbamoyladenosine tRNA methylthiotransferase MtaB
MKKVFLKSIGCRTNQVEVEGIASMLEDSGYTLVKNHSNAEIIIINTCTVTAHTESKTKRLIKSYAKNIPGVKVLVTGCLAQQLPDELMEIEGVHWVVGNTKKNDIPEILNIREKNLVCPPLTECNMPVSIFDSTKLDARDSLRTRFHIKIQEGCNFRCSYCIVPILRGSSRSVQRSEIIMVCKRAIDAGYKEIVLTGTHIGQYLHSRTYRLEALIDEICAIHGDFRLRLSSLDPRDCDAGIFQGIASVDRICKHLHLSIQSLSHKVMAGMKRSFREYDQFLERLVSFCNTCPDAGIGGDFIVGFPGETDAMFEETLNMVEQVGFNYGHVFRYSKRPGTVAASMDSQVSGKEKIRRSNTLRNCLNQMRSRFIQSQIGSIKHRIIVEQERPVKGVTSNYIRVKAPDVHARKNTWCDVVLQEYNPEKNWCIAMSEDKG